MAEEAENKEIALKISKEECKALYELVVKKDLTDEEKTKMKTIVETMPQILAQEEFTKNFQLTDLAFAYDKPENLPVLLEQSKKDIEVLNTALTNLKDCQIVYNDKNKTAAQFLLDRPILGNGELIGTQIVKNIHFLGTAKRDGAVGMFKGNIDVAFDQSETFFRSLYAKDGYGAYRDARNFRDQKVERLMLDCMALRKGKEEAQKYARRLAKAAGSSVVKKIGDVKVITDTVKDVKNRDFMEHPSEEAVQKGREELVARPFNNSKSLIVNGKPKSIESMNVDELRAYKKDNVLNVDEAKRVDDAIKAKNEANMEYRDDLDKHVPEDKDHKDKFKEVDVIDYMYNEWFLAGLSWLFDKVEDGIEWGVDKIIDGANIRRARHERALHEAKTSRMKELLEKGKNFEDGVEAYIGGVRERRNARKAYIEGRLNPLRSVDFAHLNEAEEKELRKRYSAYLIDNLKEKARKDPKNVHNFIEALSQRYQNAPELFDKTEEIAIKQVKTEMFNEVMRSSAAWQQDGKKDFKSDEEIFRDFKERCRVRQNELIESATLLRSATGFYAEEKWLKCDTQTKKDDFIKKNITDVFDKKIKKEKDPKRKESLVKQKERFNETLSAIQKDDKRSEEEKKIRLSKYVLYTITEQKVQDFLVEQRVQTGEAEAIQKKDLEACRYSENGFAPQKETAKLISAAKNDRENVFNKFGEEKMLLESAKEENEISLNLYEAALETDREKFFKALDKVFEYNEGKLQAMRDAGRKEALEKFEKEIKEKKREPMANTLSPFLRMER